MGNRMKVLKNFPKTIGFFHLGIAFFVTGSILTSLFLHGLHSPEIVIWIHVWMGYGVTVFLFLQFWAVFSKKYQKLRGHLYPYNKEGKKKIKEDIELLLRRKLPQKGYRGGLSGLVEGLGLVAITGMVITGLTFHFAAVYDLGPKFYFVYQMHSGFSGFAYAFFVGHAGMAVIQKLK